MNLTNISFAEKTGIITDGTQGIGYAIAKQFVTMGGRAVLIGRDEEKGRAATEKLGNLSSIGKGKFQYLEGIAALKVEMYMKRR